MQEHPYSCHHLFSSQICSTWSMYVFVTLNDMNYNSEVNRVYSEDQQLVFHRHVFFLPGWSKGGMLGHQEGLEGRSGGSTSWAGRGAWWGAGNCWHGRERNGNHRGKKGNSGQQKGCKLCLGQCGRWWVYVVAGLGKSRDKLIVPTCPRKVAASPLELCAVEKGKSHGWALSIICCCFGTEHELKVSHFTVKMWVNPWRWWGGEKIFVCHGSQSKSGAVSVKSCPCRAVPTAVCLLPHRLLHWFHFV